MLKTPAGSTSFNFWLLQSSNFCLGWDWGFYDPQDPPWLRQWKYHFYTSFQFGFCRTSPRRATQASNKTHYDRRTPPNRHAADPPRRRRRRWLGCMRWVSERVDDTVTDRPGRCICQSVSRRSVYERWTVIGSNVRAGSAAPRGLSARYSATRVCIVMLQQLITKNSTMQHYGWVRHRCFLLSRLSDPYTLQLN